MSTTTDHPPAGTTLHLPPRVVAWWAARDRPRWERVGAVAYLGGLTLLFFAALLGGKTLSNIPGAQLFLAPWQHQPKSFPYPQADQAYFFYPYTLVQTHAWRAATIPFWNPYNLGGIALLANGQSGILYPVRILLALFVSPSWNHDLFLVGHVLAGGLFMFAFLKELRLRFLPGLLGATGWMLASFNTSWMQVEAYLPLVAWLPAALWLTHRAARRRSWRTALAAGIPLAAMALGGNVQDAAIAFGVVGTYGLALALVPPPDGLTLDRLRRLDWPRLLYPVLALGVGAGLGAATLLPTLKLANEGGRATVSYSAFVSQHTIAASQFAHVFSAGRPDVLTLAFKLSYVGLVPLAFAFVGFALRRPGAALGRWLAAGTFLVAIGAPVLTWVVFHLVPGMSRLSTTGYLLWLFDFGLVLLAAVGLDGLLALAPRLARWWRMPGRGEGRLPISVTQAAALVGILAVLGTTIQLYHLARGINPPFTPRSSTASFYPPTVDVRAVESERATRRPDSPQRILGLTAFLANTNLVESLDDGGGYDSVVPLRQRQLWNVVGGVSVGAALSTPALGGFLSTYTPTAVRGDLLARVGVTTVVADPALTRQVAAAPNLDGLQPIYRGPDLAMYHVPASPPRAWVVHQADVAPNGPAALRAFTASGFAYREAMVVEPDQGLGPANRVVRRGAGPSSTAVPEPIALNDAGFTVRTPRAGWLVMADASAPGWTATVNGHAATVLRVDYTLRAVAIPAGRSSVTLTYRPPGFDAGLAVSVATTLVLLGVGGQLLWSHRRRSGSDAPHASTTRPVPTTRPTGVGPPVRSGTGEP